MPAYVHTWPYAQWYVYRFNTSTAYQENLLQTVQNLRTDLVRVLVTFEETLQ